MEIKNDKRKRENGYEEAKTELNNNKNNNNNITKVKVIISSPGSFSPP